MRRGRGRRHGQRRGVVVNVTVAAAAGVDRVPLLIGRGLYDGLSVLMRVHRRVVGGVDLICQGLGSRRGLDLDFAVLDVDHALGARGAGQASRNDRGRSRRLGRDDDLGDAVRFGLDRHFAGFELIGAVRNDLGVVVRSDLCNCRVGAADRDDAVGRLGRTGAERDRDIHRILHDFGDVLVVLVADLFCCKRRVVGPLREVRCGHICEGCGVVRSNDDSVSLVPDVALNVHGIARRLLSVCVHDVCVRGPRIDDIELDIVACRNR